MASPCEELPHKCPLCEKAFRKKYALERHLKSLLHQQTHYKCSICGRAFKTKVSFERHLQKVHSDEGCYKCEKCEKSFRRSAHFSKHQQSHLIQTLYRCTSSACGEVFETEDALMIHCKAHIAEDPYMCLKCSNTCNSDVSASKIGSVYKCLTCDKSFHFKKNMALHTQVHTNEEQSLCILCKKPFERISLPLDKDTHKNQNETLSGIQKCLRNTQAEYGESSLVSALCGSGIKGLPTEHTVSSLHSSNDPYVVHIKEEEEENTWTS